MELCAQCKDGGHDLLLKSLVLQLYNILKEFICDWLPVSLHPVCTGLCFVWFLEETGRGWGPYVALTGEASVMETQCVFCEVGSRVMRASLSYSWQFAGQIGNHARRLVSSHVMSQSCVFGHLYIFHCVKT